MKIQLEIKELRKDMLNRATFETLKNYDETLKNLLKQMHTNFESKIHTDSKNFKEKIKINISEMRRTLDTLKIQNKLLFP